MTKRELIDLCLTQPGAYEDYPFDDNWAVVRRSGNRKIFAWIYEREDRLCINLKCDPVQADFLRQVYSHVVPGFHMNKTHWNTVYIGGDVPLSELLQMIADSYGLTAPKRTKRA